MDYVRLQPKSQLIIPKDVKAALNIEPNDTIHFVEVRPGEYTVSKTKMITAKLQHNGKKITLPNEITNAMKVDVRDYIEFVQTDTAILMRKMNRIMAEDDT